MNYNLINTALVIFIMSLGLSCTSEKTAYRDGEKVSISRIVLQDKVKGGWAGQTIGVTYGAHTEFHYRGSIIQDYVPFLWPDGYIKKYFQFGAGYFDDVYMDLTFVDVFDRLGLDAPADSFANAFANAGYWLYHANQSARYNVLQGILPPKSGFWKNNPHADCIDYQIEADFSGLMSPGMPNTASQISGKIGHIMAYGDGWYGGVFVGAMYSLAFVSDNIEYIVNEGLKTIPDSSNFYKCIADVIKCYRQDPNNWQAAWYVVEKNWSEDIGCPEGVFRPLNIDAKLNSAYVVIGLLYGHGDYFKTLDIATRCGADSDCNPATSGGILGTVLGYSHIPELWIKNLKEVEDMNFDYINISLNKVYKMGFEQALKNIEKNGGALTDSSATIVFQSPKAVQFEKSFDGLYPIERLSSRKIDFWATNALQSLNTPFQISFDGIGYAIEGYVKGDEKLNPNYIAIIEIMVDSIVVEMAQMPLAYLTRRNEISWKYDLPKGKHNINLTWRNPKKGIDVVVKDMITYSNVPGNTLLLN